MTAIDASDVGGLVQMAGEAESYRSRRASAWRVADIGGGHRLGMFAAGAMAGFAGIVLQAALLIGLHDLVGILLEGVEDIFVAALAGGGADEFGGFVVGGRLSGSAARLLSGPAAAGWAGAPGFSWARPREGDGHGRGQRRQQQ